MTESQKLKKEREKQKKTIKRTVYYEQLIEGLNPKTVEKIKKVIEVIDVELGLLNTENSEPPYILEISQTKFLKEGLLCVDIQKILELLQADKYLVLPPYVKKEDLSSVRTLGEYYIYAPIDEWNTAVRDFVFDYPFEKNYKNFKEAIKGDSKKRSNEVIESLNLKGIYHTDNVREYKKDGLLYSLWKYANASRLTGKSLIAFTDLSPLEGSERFAIFEFLNKLKSLNIELKNITLHMDIYRGYCESEYIGLAAYATQNPKKDLSKAIKNLFKNQATFNDVFKILGEFSNLIPTTGISGLLEFIEFSPNPSEKNIKPLKKELDAYLQFFIEDELSSYEFKNFYRFSKQKEIFLAQIKNEVSSYGLRFVFRQGGFVSDSLGEDDSYLFIHTLAALEKQGFFEVKKILIVDMDVPPEKQTNDYKVKIKASEKLLDEYKQKETKAKVQRKSLKDKEIKFDDDKSLINIADEEVSLPPYKNQHFFCRAVFKYPKKEFVDWEIIYEEITGDKIRDENIDKRKQDVVYNAMKLVNDRVKEIIGTEDNLFKWKDKAMARIH